VVSDQVLYLSEMPSNSSGLYGRRRRLRVREPLRFAIQCITTDPDHMEHCECFVQSMRKSNVLFVVPSY
jgi:hypothetical protein